MKSDTNTLYKIQTLLPGEEYSLFDLAKWKNGLAFKKINFSDAGIPVIKIAELNNGIGGTTAYTRQIFPEDVHIHKGDLLFSWSGNPQTSIDIYRFQLKEGWLNQHIFKVVPNELIVDKDYFYFLMKYLKPHFSQIATNKQTTGLGHVTIDDIKRMRVNLPAFGHQKAIAKILKSIDDKIELNNAINQNLEQQAQALFKSWFIDFEPFGGSVPENWASIRFGKIATIKTEIFSPTKNPDKIVEHYSIPAYDEKRYPVFEPATNIKSNKYILTPMSVMISKLNPDMKRIWRPLCISDTPVSSTEFIVFEAVNPIYRDFVYSVLDSVPFYQYLCAHTTGSTNSRQRATPKATLNFPLLLPNDTAIQKFCSIVSPMYDLIAKNIMENQSLAYTRDSILPKLMSGELDVSAINI